MSGSNPMDLSNLLSSPAATPRVNDSRGIYNEHHNERLSKEESSYSMTLSYRPASNDSGPPTPPSSACSPVPRHQQLNYTAPVRFHGGYGQPMLPMTPVMNHNYQPYHVQAQPYSPQYQNQQRIQLPSLEQLNLGVSRHLPQRSASRSPARAMRKGTHGKHGDRSRPHRPCDYLPGRGHPRSPDKPKKKQQSNVKYTDEQADFVRYNKEDLNRHWNDVRTDFAEQFPRENRQSNQCLQSRYYRGNYLPDPGSSWMPTLDDTTNKVKLMKVKVRDRSQPEYKDVPNKFIERHPLRALSYDWVHQDSKNEALAIIEQDRKDEEMGHLTEAGKWRKLMLLSEKAGQSCA